jgi:hypothetical protein
MIENLSKFILRILKKNSKLYSLALAMQTFFFSTLCIAGITNPTPDINKLLLNKGRFVKERNVDVVKDELICEFDPAAVDFVRPPRVCHYEKVVVSKKEQYEEEAKVASFHIVTVSDLRPLAEKITKFPVKAHLGELIITNCGKTKDLTPSLGFDESVTHTDTVTMSRSVTDGTTASAKLSYSDKSSGWGAEIGISFTHSVQIGKQEGFVDTSTETRKENVTAQVTPMTQGRATFRVYELTEEIPFLGTAVVDGMLDTGKAVSDLLSEQERTFQLEGTLNVTGVSSGEYRYDEKPLNDKYCSDQPSENIQKVEHPYAYSMPIRSSLIHKDVVKKELANRKSKLPLAKLPPKPLTDTGSWCYTGPCNSPLDGTRPICYGDENNACNDCRDESDSVCQPDTQNGNQ